MSTLAQFLLNNALPALVAGCLAWAFVHAAVTLFRIRHGKLRLCLYLAPLLKSTLVLIGMHAVLRWPQDLFGAWAARALPPSVVLPPFLVLTGAFLLGRNVLAGRQRARLLAGARPAAAGERLDAALDRVMASYRRNEARIRARCSLEPLPGRPALMVRERGLRTPAVVADQRPVIVFPEPLLARLDDGDIEGALAHEVAHLYLRQPTGCFSSEYLRSVSALNPFAGVMASQLHREEEKACDDIAVDILGDTERYAGMLLRSYRHAATARGPVAGGLQFVSQLLGARGVLSDRVEHLMARDDPGISTRQRFAFVLTWIVLIAVFFTQ